MKTKTETTTFYVVMAKDEAGRLFCLGREGGATAGSTIAFGYKVRTWAEKFEAKMADAGYVAGVYAVKGQSFNELRTESDHYDLAAAAEMMFNQKKAA